VRERGWAEADQRASELIGSIEQSAAGVVDDEVRQAIMQKVADARGEWARTEYPSFRMKTDAGETLAGLQEILFDAQAAALPETGLPIGKTASEQQVDMRRATGDLGGRGQGASAQRRQTDTGKRQTPREQADAEPGRRAEREKRGLPGRTYDPNAPKRKLSGEGDVKRLRNFVLERAQKTLSVGGDRAAKVKQLRDEIARDLGLDPSSPDVFAVVKEALSEAYGRTGKAANGSR